MHLNIVHMKHTVLECRSLSKSFSRQTAWNESLVKLYSKKKNDHLRCLVTNNTSPKSSSTPTRTPKPSSASLPQFSMCRASLRSCSAPRGFLLSISEACCSRVFLALHRRSFRLLIAVALTVVVPIPLKSTAGMTCDKKKTWYICLENI